MIAALLLGREGSQGFPGKNLYPVMGRPLMEYPLLAAKYAKTVNATYVSTDSPKIKEIGRKNGARIIDRPRNCVHPRRWERMHSRMVTDI